MTGRGTPAPQKVLILFLFPSEMVTESMASQLWREVSGGGGECWLRENVTFGDLVGQ